jgi:hypothetical protein
MDLDRTLIIGPVRNSQRLRIPPLPAETEVNIMPAAELIRELVAPTSEVIPSAQVLDPKPTFITKPRRPLDGSDRLARAIEEQNRLVEHAQWKSELQVIAEYARKLSAKHLDSTVPPLAPPSIINDNACDSPRRRSGAPRGVQIDGTLRARPGRKRNTPNLHPEVEPYLEGVRKGRRITFEEFCAVSGFGDDTVFGAWRRGDNARCTPGQAKSFENTLRLDPAEFLRRLAEKSR